MSALLRSPKGRIGVIVAGGLLLVAAAWFLLVSPQRSKASELSGQITTARTELAQRRLAASRPSADISVKSSDLYRLSKALPSQTDMPGILLDVSRLADRNTLDFRSIAPGAPMPGSGYLQQPLSVIVQGRFADVSRFLGDLRTLVGVRKGRLDARGRLYSVSTVDMSEPDNAKKFPIVQAKVTLNAFSFSAPTPATTPPTSSDTSSDGSVAAGATP